MCLKKIMQALTHAGVAGGMISRISSFKIRDGSATNSRRGQVVVVGDHTKRTSVPGGGGGCPKADIVREVAWI